MGDLMHVKVGDPLVIFPGYNGRVRKTQVTKVGRKYLYVEHDREGYERATGRRLGGYGGSAYTPEEHAENEAYDALMEQLRGVGVEVSAGSKLTREQRKVVARAVIEALGTSKG